MSLLVQYLLVALAAFGVEAFNAHDRVIGGTNAKIESHPYQVSIEYFRVHMCGGSVITSQWILTAAHCISGNEVRNMRARAGSAIRESGGTVHDAQTAKIHPSYKSGSFDFDVAVLSVNPVITWTTSVQPASLPTASSEPAANSVVIVTGWGYTSVPSDLSRTAAQMATQLQQAALKVVSRSSCLASYGSKLTARMICASAKGKDACKYDSGGPLVDSSGRLVGVVSHGQGCADIAYPGVYANVANSDVRSFIQRNCGV